MHPQDGEQYPIGSRIYDRTNNKKGTVIGHCFQFQGRNFLHYEVHYDGHKGRGHFVAYHKDIFLISKPEE